jgi:pilus assembly protein CpaB
MDQRAPAWLTQLIRTASWHRRLLAGGLAAAAVALAIHAAEPPPDPAVQVVAAARDLPGGSTLGPDDVELIDVPPAVAPGTTFDAVGLAVGQRTAGPIRTGEIITDVRLVSGALLDGWGDDLVAVPVRIADPATTQLVRAGDLIDVLAAPTSGAGDATVLATGIPVLAMPPAGDRGAADGALLVVAATSDQATSLAQAAVTARLSVALRGS